MGKTTFISRLLAGVLFAGLSAHAGVILDVSSSALTLADPTQTGRLSRNGLAQDWTGSETFPGVINTGTTYRYHVYSVNVGNTPFVQVTFDSVSANTFLSAYDTSYLPDSAGSPNFGFDTNWLGDAGSSGNFFGTDPIFFQVVVPVNHTLLLVLANTGAANVGVGDTFSDLLVEGFIDTEFGEPSPVPEPSSMFLGAGGLLLLPLIGRVRNLRSRKS